MRSEIPRLTRAQRSQCLIEYTFDGTEITFEDRAGNILNTGKILLKLASRINGDLHAFGVFFNNRQLEWEQIPITYTHCSE
jgi:hypothetical protein